MNKIFTFCLTFCSLFSKAQFTVSAFPSDESDSLYNYSANHYELQYNIQRFYDVHCLDSFKLFTNTTGPTMRQYLTWPAGTTSQQPLGRSYDLRPVDILAQQYQVGNWVNYIHNGFNKFLNSCLDSSYSSQSWSGSSWYLTLGDQATATFLANGNPSSVHTLSYDYGTGSWLNSLQQDFYYTPSYLLRSVHYRRWSSNASSYVDYIDSNYLFSNYSSYCHNEMDSMVTYSKTGSTYLPYGKQTTTHYPYDGYMYEYMTHNGTSWVKSMKYEQYYDQHANDSLYKQWHWNTTTQQYDLVTYRVYTNSYDANGNLIRQELFKNLNSATPTVLYPYSIKGFSNFIPCGGSVTQLDQVKEILNFSITPNPSHGQLSIEIPEDKWQNKSLTLKDITGRIVLEQKIINTKTTLTFNFPQGLYFVSVSDGKEVSTKKIVIE